MRIIHDVTKDLGEASCPHLLMPGLFQAGSALRAVARWRQRRICQRGLPPATRSRLHHASPGSRRDQREIVSSDAGTENASRTEGWVGAPHGLGGWVAAGWNPLIWAPRKLGRSATPSVIEKALDYTGDASHSDYTSSRWSRGSSQEPTWSGRLGGRTACWILTDYENLPQVFGAESCSGPFLRTLQASTGARRIIGVASGDAPLPSSTAECPRRFQAGGGRAGRVLPLAGGMGGLHAPGNRDYRRGPV